MIGFSGTLVRISCHRRSVSLLSKTFRVAQLSVLPEPPARSLGAYNPGRRSPVWTRTGPNNMHWLVWVGLCLLLRETPTAALQWPYLQHGIRRQMLQTTVQVFQIPSNPPVVQPHLTSLACAKHGSRCLRQTAPGNIHNTPRVTSFAAYRSLWDRWPLAPLPRPPQLRRRLQRTQRRLPRRFQRLLHRSLA